MQNVQTHLPPAVKFRRIFCHDHELHKVNMQACFHTYPDRPFHNFRSPQSRDRLILFSSGTSYFGFWSSKIVKESVGISATSGRKAFLKKKIRSVRNCAFFMSDQTANAWFQKPLVNFSEIHTSLPFFLIFRV